MPESLRVQLHKHLDEWLHREAKRLRDDNFAYGAELRIRLSNPGADDDGALCL
jgi:hypothetical protein